MRRSVGNPRLSGAPLGAPFDRVRPNAMRALLVRKPLQPMHPLRCLTPWVAAPQGRVRWRLVADVDAAALHEVVRCSCGSAHWTDANCGCDGKVLTCRARRLDRARMATTSGAAVCLSARSVALLLNVQSGVAVPGARRLPAPKMVVPRGVGVAPQVASGAASVGRVRVHSRSVWRDTAGDRRWRDVVALRHWSSLA
jgi:hypothetical protein